MLKFLVDESSGRKLVKSLSDEGHDALYCIDLLPEASDEKILEGAKNNKRILITNDKDFGEFIFRYKKLSHGAIFLRLKVNKPENRIKSVLSVIDIFGGKLNRSLPLLRSLLTDNWINEELGKNKPSTLIWLIKHREPRLQHLENNLNYFGSDEINQHKEHILEYLKGGIAQVYGIISEIDVWAHLKKFNIFCVYQPKIDDFDKNPDFLIKLDQEDIIVEVAALNEDKHVKDKMTAMLEEFKLGNKLSGHFVVNEVTQNSDCYRIYDLLKGKTKQLRKEFKNILIINTLFADGSSLRNAIRGYYQIEKDDQQIGCIDGNKREKGFFEQKEIHRRVNLIVGYNNLINNCSLYFHNSPYIPFTQKEKESLAKYFLRQIDNAMNGNNVVEVIK